MIADLRTKLDAAVKQLVDQTDPDAAAKSQRQLADENKRLQRDNTMLMSENERYRLQFSELTKIHDDLQRRAREMDSMEAMSENCAALERQAAVLLADKHKADQALAERCIEIEKLAYELRE